MKKLRKDLLLRSIITIILASCSKRKDTFKISRMKRVKRKKKRMMKKKTRKRKTQMRKMTMITKKMRMKIVQTDEPS